MAMKYQPLVEYVAAQTEQALTLTFAEIEGILGRPLSVSAQVSQSVWRGAAYRYVFAWQAAGWTATLDRRNRCVHFARTEGG